MNVRRAEGPSAINFSRAFAVYSEAAPLAMSSKMFNAADSSRV